MKRRSIVTTLALICGLVAGAIFGPSFTTTASAQSTPATTSTTDSLRTLFLDKLAAALNIDRAALDSAITSAGTATADEAVQAGTLTQAQADALKQRVQQDGLWAFGRGSGGGSRGVSGVRTAMSEAAAQALGTTADELKTQLQSGQTLAQLAAAHNTTEQAVIDAALAAAKTKLDAAVAAGTVTQAQADTAYAELQARGSDLLSGGRGGHGGRGNRGGSASPDASPSAAPSATTTTSA